MWDKLLYYFLYAVMYLVSLLPFSVLYFISDVAKVVLFSMLGYRKAVIFENVRNAFPDKSESDIQVIIRQFQQSFCDQWLETIKLLSISPKALQKRVQTDVSIINNDVDRNVYLLLGHQFNWEWSNALANQQLDKPFSGIYLHIKNKAFNQLMLKLRSRFGNHLISATEIIRELRQLNKQQFVLGMIADQSPGNQKTSLWYNFMHRPARFSIGPQKIIGSKNAAVYFVNSKKIKRGYYYISLQEICNNASQVKDNHITDTFVALLQNALHEQPYNWLWSHRRWKQTIHKDDVIQNA